jgi:clan AA aspartic protease (TIGR02281 family)
VELALAEGNWQEAERLLYTARYPQSLLDRSRLLEARISRIKGEEGKIVIRFNPGAGEIPVRALVNGTVHQDFLIDTAASIVSISTSTVEALGINVSASLPRRQVATAGGVRVAPEVVLSSLELDGWTVNNIKALVLDIPKRPGVGLLGLNYLSRFRMELDDKNGVLLLKPR